MLTFLLSKGKEYALHRLVIVPAMLILRSNQWDWQNAVYKL